MSAINNGGPAFPVPLNEGQSWQGMAPCDGMTLRDYFAASSVTGLLANPAADPVEQVHFDNIARDAYRMADAMLRAREATS